MTRVLFISDLHGRLPDASSLPKVDLLLIGGDIAPLGATSQEPELALATRWLQEVFGPWLANVKQVVGCEIAGAAGNHDFFAEYPWGERLLKSFDWHYLRDQSITLCNLNIFGSPWSPPHPAYPNWAFQQADYELKRQWEKIPRGTDILLVHTPPKGVVDEIEIDEPVGSQSLTECLIKRKDLRGAIPLICCGHIHEAGMERGNLADSIVVNGSMTTVASMNRQRGMLITYLNNAIKVEKVKLKVASPRKDVLIDNTKPVSFYQARLKAERFR